MNAAGSLVCISIFWIGCVLAGGLLGAQKNQRAAGLLLTFLFGPLGLLGILMLERAYTCPTCCDAVKKPASVCPHCRQVLDWRTGQPVAAEQSRPAAPPPMPGVSDLNEDAAAGWLNQRARQPAPPPPPPPRLR